MANKRVRGLAIHRPIIYGNDARIIPLEERKADGHTHTWTVAVKAAAAPPGAQEQSDDVVFGGADDLSCFIKKVTFKLHETIPNPLRTVDKPPFEVTETGWGEFDIQIKIFFVTEAAEKPVAVNHHLKLHPWPLNLHTGPNNLIAPAPKAAESRAAANGDAATGGAADSTPAATSSEQSSSLQVKAETLDNAASEPAANAMDVDSAGSRPQTSLSGSQAQPIAVDNPAAVPQASVASSVATQQPSQANGLAAEQPNAQPQIIATPVHAWQYDEIVFNEPTEALYSILISSPATPLPETSKRQKVTQIPNGGGGAIGELTRETEAQEGARLDFARKELLEELDRLREKLLTTESNLREAKQELQSKTD